jgi:hypothetical protein
MSDRMQEGAQRAGVRAGMGLGLCLGLALSAGCATQPPSDSREVRIGDNLNIYDMYDNSRPWGSSYLVGPPTHHDGDQSRVDDLRAPPPRAGTAVGGSAADPSNPPASGAAPATLTSKPLPPLP